MGFKIAGNGIRYTHGTGNDLIFLLGKREKYELIVNADYLLVIVDPLVTVHEDGCHARGGAVDGNN